ncbi:cyanophycin synthetase [Paraglaciecola mesophila KMM 241]|uniref:Cyanophycin synthetase n=1 Tax=Paraglaciecola mesophila KMM 241 TaxID=1128912 RepID=K6XTB3_9ALTE|nr:cyanophycin synthetase [Paraglaciecola mesophila]GAC23839.1 cyanophycin synthetase [Paraglaciecola mesophila KMM 241]|tara:strand:- start:4635 stop:7451 length:2817 start_codon:yes stop_codon:yes gene_type:complete
MKIISSNVYVGPNVYANFPVIRHQIDIGELENWPSVKLGEGFINGLIAALPTLQSHGCSYREEGGFLRRLKEDEGTWIGHIWEHVALELQHLAGSDVTYGKTRSSGKLGCYDVVYQYKQRDVGLEAGELGLRLLKHLMPKVVQDALVTATSDDFDFSEELHDFIRMAQRKEFGPSTGSLVSAAEARDIPWLRLNNYSLVQFGHGKYQKRIQATITSETKHIAVEISCDKEDTHNLLNDLGLPVPQQIMVYGVPQAIRAAKKIGYPVVVKPLNANHGRGVTINLLSDEQVGIAFEEAQQFGTGKAVLVESYLSGFDHRMLVVNNELVAVAKRVPGNVVGDGKSTISELVDLVNLDPRRGIGHEKVLTRLELDNQALRLLEEADYDENTILEEGQLFYLRSTANLSTGGTSIDVTDIVHPDNRDMAVRAIKAIGLDIGGVDFLTEDISKSYKEIGGGICECNAAPGFRMHVAPSEGKPRDVSGKVMDMLFPLGSEARIPVAAITGTNGKTTTSRMLASIVKSAGFTTGMTSTDGVYIDGHLTVKGDMTGPTSAQIVLRDPSVDFAILETARGGILKRGLGYTESNVSACLNVTADHLGLRGIDTVEQLAKIKRVVVEVAKDCVVLNADDILCLQMADYCEAEHIFYVTMNPGHGLVREHIRRGGLAAVLEKGINGDMITIYDKGAHIPLLWTHLIPATIEGKALHNVQNAMFAAAMAYSFKISLEDIRQGLRIFNTSFYQAPGRLNIYDEHPFKVILDYAHNPAAIQTITDLALRLDITGKRRIVMAMPGDRRDEDIIEAANITAEGFDSFICKADDDRRRRGFDEVPQLLKQTLLAAGISESDIQVIPSEEEAIESALNQCEKGDLLIILGDDITRCWKQIVHFNAEEGDATTEDEPSHTYPEKLYEPIEHKFELAEGQRLVHDERGVRLIVEHDEESD